MTQREEVVNLFVCQESTAEIWTLGVYCENWEFMLSKELNS